MAEKSIVSNEMISIANKLLGRFGHGPTIKNLNQCNHNFFINIYEQMMNEKLPGLISDAKEPEEQIHNIQVVIDLLATDVLGVDLSHIDAQSIVQGNELHIQNLLEIFDGLLEFVMEELEKEDDDEIEQNDDNEDLDDSNAIKDDHEILSDVFQEEFGHSYADRNSTNNDRILDEPPISPLKKAFHSEIISVKNTKKQFTFDQPKGNNSTNELILEAELLERQQEKTAKSDQQGVASEWSSILEQTTSAVNSLNADVNEIGKRPRRQLGVEIRQEEEGKIEGDGENGKQKKERILRHQHMHHHFHHKIDKSSSTDISTSSSPSSSSSSSFKFKYDSKKKKIQEDGEQKKNKLTDSWVQTDQNYTNNLPSHKEFLNSLHETSLAESTRSRQLSELSNRLQTLRSELNETTKKDVKTSADKENQPLDEEENGNERKSKKKKRDANNKVSFAENIVSHTNIPCYSSDTDIDYSSPAVRWKRKTLKSQKQDFLADLARARFSSGEDDYPPQSKPNISQRFSKRAVEKDERMKDVMMQYRAHDVVKERQLDKIRHDYSRQRNLLVNDKDERIKQTNMGELNKLTKKYQDRSPRRKPQHKVVANNEYAKNLAAIYKGPTRGRTEFKNRKRSASASPVGRRRFKSRMVVKEDEILPIMEDEFPFIHLSPHTAKLMWQKQMRQVNTIYKAAHSMRPSKAQQQIEEAQKKQEMLAKLIKKELDHNNRLKEYKDQKFQQGLVKKKLAERRQRSARARKYYDDYVVKNKSRMMNKRSREEKIFKQLFEDGLEIQRERLRELKKYAREQREKNEEKQKNEIESMENYYRGQFAMLAETIAQERHDLQVRQKAQNQLLHKMRKEMRKKMEHDIEMIQDQLINEQDSSSFRQIDADNMRKEFQLATFKSAKF